VQETNHLVGIIALNSQPMDFNFPWADCMIPIAADFLAVERAVLECATAGCNTIWLVCPMKFSPLLRHRIGDYVQDPIYFSNKYAKFSSIHRKEIPIYYVPVHPNDKDKRDSIVWNLLYGCHTALKISGKISKWLIPEKYYICFPNAVYPSQYIRKYRHDIVHKRRFLISYGDKTLLNGEYLGGTINNQDLKFLIKEFRNQATGLFSSEIMKDGIFPREKLPIDQRYSGRFLTLKDIFSKLPLEQETEVMKTKWYYPLDNWEDYCVYLSSVERFAMKRPIRPLLKYKEFRGISNNESKQ